MQSSYPILQMIKLGIHSLRYFSPVLILLEIAILSLSGLLFVLPLVWVDLS